MSALRGQRHPERELVGRGEQDTAGVTGLLDVGSLVVDVDDSKVQAEFGHRLPVPFEAVALGGPGRGSLGFERLPDQPQPMHRAQADDDLVGVYVHSSHPGQVVGQRRS